MSRKQVSQFLVLSEAGRVQVATEWEVREDDDSLEHPGANSNAVVEYTLADGTDLARLDDRTFECYESDQRYFLQG